MDTAGAWAKILTGLDILNHYGDLLVFVATVVLVIVTVTYVVINWGLLKQSRDTVVEMRRDRIERSLPDMALDLKAYKPDAGSGYIYYVELSNKGRGKAYDVCVTHEIKEVRNIGGDVRFIGKRMDRQQLLETLCADFPPDISRLYDFGFYDGLSDISCVPYERMHDNRLIFTFMMTYKYRGENNKEVTVNRTFTYDTASVTLDVSIYAEPEMFRHELIRQMKLLNRSVKDSKD